MSASKAIVFHSIFHKYFSLRTMGKLEKCLMSHKSIQKLHFSPSVIVEKEDICSKEKGELTHSKKIKRLDFSDPKLSNIMIQIKSKKFRKESGLFYFEGKTLLKDAIFVGIKPELIFFTRMKDIDEIQPDDSIKLFKVPYNDLKIWSDLSTPPGILAICKKSECIRDYSVSIPVNVICDQIRDPGNLGSLLRTAAGAGVKKVILSKGCTDLWDPRVLRGGTGAHFRIPILDSLDWSLMQQHIEEPTALLTATNRVFSNEINETKNITSFAVPYYQLNYKNLGNVTLIIGGENQGISKEALSFSKYRRGQDITIPLSNRVESLNSVSALSAILYEIKRQFNREKSDTCD